MLNALTEAVAVVPRPMRAAHEADSQRSTSDGRRSRVVPLNPLVSDLKYQPSSLSLQVSVLSSSALPLHLSSLSSQPSSLSPPFLILFKKD